MKMLIYFTNEIDDFFYFQITQGIISSIDYFIKKVCGWVNSIEYFWEIGVQSLETLYITLKIFNWDLKLWFIKHPYILLQFWFNNLHPPIINDCSVAMFEE